ncbi:MAG TPA: hypothetical protein DCY95_21810 [Algoriphagus sp.]|uniref:hypothetical protein n=3 Tax=Algoriphagus TaxID=246875 RepID=UPI000C5A2B04|nr:MULTISPECIES: hypothetical protein [unclassified Algoriphagus]MAL14001.1 hypothetical protein [Algoriphagus sp.]QYH38017.1 hypothetical protein GYM62_04095 [Algoriphagus sp. NBT04N3]HAD51739.1 hypothetical protein [Algoriphagus sp.]HAH35026.1 hypothetical protein [Algoriphagus sp.]HAZ26876.1 hypothetical protein [Algoriphagus sp.]
MLSAVLLVLFLFFVSQPFLNNLQKEHKWLKAGLLNQMYWYHMFFGLVYWTYAQFNRSDSQYYYYKTQFLWKNWFDAFSAGTDFIEWLSFPWVRFLGFNYDMTMFLFTWLGYWGFVYFYCFMKENLRFNPKFEGWDAITIFMFLPNMHFWTASLGKGAVIFAGIGFLTYGLSWPGKRIPHLIFGGFLCYMVRPHILFAVMIGMGLSFVFGREKVPTYQKYLVALAGIGVSIFVYEDLITYLGYDPNNLVESFEEESTLNAQRLQSAGSGVDMTSYSLPMKLFTFWFRPLFIDSPNALGIIVSIENALYIYMFSKVFKKSFIDYMRIAPAMVKMSAVVFISISISMTFVMSNLGIIIRQKSQIMYYMLFVIVAFMDWEKTNRIKKRAEIYNRIVEEERRKREEAAFLEST